MAYTWGIGISSPGLKREARERGLSSGAVTFINHPWRVLYPEQPISYLSTPEERVRLIGELGLELVVPITFDLELSMLTARQYLERLQEHLRMRGLVVGPDFALGHQREGDTRVLAALGQEMGFSIEVVDPLYLGEVPVRSTVIREALSRGDIGKATKLLGRNFSLYGEVAAGFGRGKGLGFPTANLQVAPERLLPGDGIYATWARLDDEPVYGGCEYRDPPDLRAWGAHRRGLPPGLSGRPIWARGEPGVRPAHKG